MQGYKGDQDAPVVRLMKLGDQHQHKTKWLASLEKQWDKRCVKVQTWNLEWLGERERTIERAGGFGGIVAIVPT